MLLLCVLFFACITVEPSKNPFQIDNDLDGYSESEGDCDDTIPIAFPGAAENDSSYKCMIDEDDDV